MNGEGSLYQRANGRWVGAVTLEYDTNGRPVRKEVSAMTKTEARQKLKDLQDKLEDGYTPPAREETLAQLFERWDRDVLSTQVQSGARDNYMTVAKCHIIPTLGKKKVSALTVADVQHLTAMKLRGGPDNVPRPLSVSTVRRIRSVLAQVLDVCLVERSLLRNVAKLTKAPKAGQTEGRTLTPAEAKRLLKALEDHRLGLLFIVMLATGLRRGEALGQQWEDLDFRKHTVGVHRQLRRIDGHLVTRAVKGGKSGRTVYLPDQVVRLLKEHRMAQTAHLKTLGVEGAGFIFTTQRDSA